MGVKKTIADLVVKITAKDDGVKPALQDVQSELKKTQEQSSQTFKTDPVDGFNDSLESFGNSVEEKTRGLAKMQSALAGVAGILTGLGGLAVGAAVGFFQLVKAQRESAASAAAARTQMLAFRNDLDEFTKTSLRDYADSLDAGRQAAVQFGAVELSDTVTPAVREAERLRAELAALYEERRQAVLDSSLSNEEQDPILGNLSDQFGEALDDVEALKQARIEANKAEAEDRKQRTIEEFRQRSILATANVDEIAAYNERRAQEQARAVIDAVRGADPEFAAELERLERARIDSVKASAKAERDAAREAAEEKKRIAQEAAQAELQARLDAVESVKQAELDAIRRRTEAMERQFQSFFSDLTATVGTFSSIASVGGGGGARRRYEL